MLKPAVGPAGTEGSWYSLFKRSAALVIAYFINYSAQCLITPVCLDKTWPPNKAVQLKFS